MGQDSAIEWTDATWQTVAGCTRVSPGCQNCYAEVMAGRLASMADADLKAGRDPGKKLAYLDAVNAPYGPKSGWNRKVVTLPGNLEEPLRWKKPRRIFVNSMSDLFHADVPFAFIDLVFAAMAQAHWHTYQVLTKRPERMAEYFNSRNSHLAMTRCFRNFINHEKPVGPWPLPNVWLGTSVEDQQRADERIPHLTKCPAAVRFLSCEPLLGPVVLPRGHVHFGFPSHITSDGRAVGAKLGIHWVIAGGESGHGARPSHPDWFRSLRDQCVAAGVAFFFKQWGQFGPVMEPPYPSVMVGGDEVVGLGSIGKKAAGRLLDGREWNEMPVM